MIETEKSRLIMLYKNKFYLILFSLSKLEIYSDMMIISLQYYVKNNSTTTTK